MKVVSRQTEIDYNMTIHDAVRVCACPRTNEDIKDENIEDLFATPSSESLVTFELHCFEEDISTDDALVKIKSLGKRPSTVKESLLFAAANPSIQCEHAIVSLGSAVRTGEERAALFLYKDKKGLTQQEMEYFSLMTSPNQNEIVRSAQLGLYENIWSTIVYFLVTEQTPEHAFCPEV